MKKLNINTSVYFYGKQPFITSPPDGNDKFNKKNISAKATINTNKQHTTINNREKLTIIKFQYMKQIFTSKLFLLFVFIFFQAILNYTYSQNKPISEMTREDVLSIKYNDLAELELDELMKLADIAGVSLEELYELLLNPNVTIASKQKESTLESPLSTTVISSIEIEQSGATCLEEVLKLIPGFIIREKTNGNYDVHIRGNDNIPSGEMLLYSGNTMTLVMIDNRIVYNYFQGGTHWESLPINIHDIERVEVIRGAASALYGPNAVSGVIHFITKNPNAGKLKFDADIIKGNADTRLGRFAMSFGKKKFRTRLSLNYQYKDRFNELYPTSSKTNLTKTEMDTMFFYIPFESDSLYPRPLLSNNRLGFNAFFFYDVNDDIKFDMAFGVQNSENQSIHVDIGPSFLNITEMTTAYSDFKAKIYNFNAHLSFIAGEENDYLGWPGMHYDTEVLQAEFDYLFQFKNLSIRPGVSYQQAIYNDAAYISNGYGYLNGSKKLNTLSFNVRGDYTIGKRLRLIAAIRSDKYNKPDDNYLSWQFITTYKLNEKNLIRALYSRANRSAFMSDTYAAYPYRMTFYVDTTTSQQLRYKNENSIMIYQLVNFTGNDKLKLPTMDMLEIGFRSKLKENLFLDIEAFYTKTKDFSIGEETDFYSNPQALYPEPSNTITIQYQNIDVESKQFGITASLNYANNEKWKLKFFGTLQQTNLFDAKDTQKSPWDKENNLVDIEHETTPAYYGGIIANYFPVKKISINTSIYFYGKQTFISNSPNMPDYNKVDICSKLTVNTNIEYKIFRFGTITLNFRNLFNSDNQEFIYGDNNKRLILFGVKLRF